MPMKTDAQIQQDVLRELEWDTRVKQTDIGVSVHGGVVTLTGTVSSYPERLVAQEAAHRVGGVLDVANDLEVKFPRDLTRDDTDVALAVRRALEEDVTVPDERIRSTVSKGVVTLEGDVDAAHEREDAERAVRNLVGVRAIANQIIVLGPAEVAEAVRASIEEALERRIDRAVDRLEVRVANGAVTLSGSLESPAEKEAALAAARYTLGVRAVTDRLTVEPGAAEREPAAPPAASA